ncbi:MAG: DUF1697 domain-containing protein [Nitrospirota bacterium]
MTAYIALLRGINAGKNRRVDMKKLEALFERSGYADVSTYINSGNVIFYSDKMASEIRREIEVALKKEFKFDIPTLIKSRKEMQDIAKAIPGKWQNDAEQRTDVAYLFEEIDSKKTLDTMPVNKEYIDVRYVKGAIYWNIDRKNYNKSRLNKLIGHKFYQSMTVRNVNTARFLAGYTTG